MSGAVALEDRFWERREEVEAFLSCGPGLIYSSSDLRDSGERACSVDVNVFPGGFNNLASLGEASNLFRRFIGDRYPDASRVAVLPESHTENRYYFDNLWSLREALRGSGFEAEVATFDGALSSGSFEGASKGRVDYLSIQEFGPDVVVMNNDLSDGSLEELEELGVPVEPAQAMGWWRRSKGEFFSILEAESAGLAEVLGVDGWRLFPETRLVEGVDFGGDLEDLAAAVDDVVEDSEGRPGTDAVFLKDDRGTYGQGSTVVGSGDEVRGMSSTRRKSMAVGKGGHEVEAVVVQEGIPTRFDVDGAPAEPVQYVVGGDSAGYFWRAREGRDMSVLNNPGQEFHPPAGDLSKETIYMHEALARLGHRAAALQASSSEKNSRQ